MTRERWRQLRGLVLAVKFSLENKLYAADSDAVIAQAVKELRDGTKSQEDVAALIEHAFFSKGFEKDPVPKTSRSWGTPILVVVVFILMGVVALVVMHR